MTARGLWDIVRARFGRTAYPEIHFFTVSTSATQLLKDDPDRIMYIIFNTGDFPLFVGWDANVSRTRGVRVPEKGGQFIVNWEDDGILPSFALWGVSPDGTTYAYILAIRLGV